MPAAPGQTQIGFIGLGIMGAPMAKNLLKAGYKLNVYNRSDRTRVQEVIDAGGVRVGSPKEAANGADVVISIVTDTPDMEAVLIGDDGAIHGVDEGAVVIDMSTVSPKVTQEVAAALKETDPPQYFEAVKLLKEASAVWTQLFGPEHEVVRLVNASYDTVRAEYTQYLQDIAKKGNEKP